MHGDCLIQGGMLVIPGTGIFPGDVLIENGKIKAIGNLAREAKANKVIDADGLHVLPGLIDPHVHLGLFNDFDADCGTESAAALCGGVTSMGIFFGGKIPYEEILDDVWQRARKRICNNLFFHLFLITEHQVNNIQLYYDKYGIRSFKAYMAGVPNIVQPLDDGLLLRSMRSIAALPGQVPLCLHTENENIVNRATEELIAAHPEGITLEQWSESHPNICEEEALLRAAFFAKQTGCRMYAVHLSTAESARRLPQIADPNIFFETITPYLTCSKKDDFGLMGKMLPPFRDYDDIEALWDALAKGYIHTIGNDHISITRETKIPAADMLAVKPAGPCIETYLPACITEGYFRRKIDLLSLVEKMTANPAKIFGLYPRKGTIALGADADLTLIDLDKEKTVAGDSFCSASKWSFHDQKRFKGWPVYTIMQGRVVAQEGRLLTEMGSGAILNGSY